MRRRHFDMQNYFSVRQLLINLLLCIAPCLTMMGQTKVADDVVDVLAEMGFENIGCVEEDKESIRIIYSRFM